MNCTEVTTRVSSPVGEISITACENGLHSIASADSTDGNFKGDIDVTVTKLTNDGNNITSDCVNWLKVYFAKTAAEKVELPALCTKNRSKCFLAIVESISDQSAFDATGEFRVKVWETLAKTQVGETLSYSELSERVVGHRKASRAMGSAMSNNPWPLIVPCHRVIRSTGQIGDYSFGKRNHVKRFLLHFEQEKCKKLRVGEDASLQEAA